MTLDGTIKGSVQLPVKRKDPRVVSEDASMLKEQRDE
jgi:hypothetical protein